VIGITADMKTKTDTPFTGISMYSSTDIFKTPNFLLNVTNNSRRRFASDCRCDYLCQPDESVRCFDEVRLNLILLRWRIW